MQPYPNPNYFQQTTPIGYQPYQPQPNPYLDRSMNSFQPSYQAQQPVIQQNMNQPQNVPSRIVDGFETITADSVPMDNLGAIFIKRDGTEIQHRIWNGNGSIQVSSYALQKPQIDDESKNTNILSPEEQKAKFEAFESVLSGISEKVNEMHAKIDEMSAKKTGRPKKDIEEE